MLLFKLFYPAFMSAAVTPLVAAGVYFLSPVIGWWSMVIIPIGVFARIFISRINERRFTRENFVPENTDLNTEGNTHSIRLEDDSDILLDPEYHSLMGNINNDD